MSDFDKRHQRRIVRREQPVEPRRFDWSSLLPSELLQTLRTYFGLGRSVRPEPIDHPEALARFLETRASYVAQVSLYGYLRTRAGMRYPELFDDDPFVVSINIAKWHMWLDSLSDITVYSGSRIAQHAPRESPRVAGLMVDTLGGILSRTGTPADAGPEFGAHAGRVRDRVARTDWLAIGPDEAAFSESPAGLVRWAPIIEELKQLDDEIVRNSVRFRWQEVRRYFAEHLDAQALLEALSRPGPGQG